MNKVSGHIEDFSYFYEDESRTVIGYGLTKINEEIYEWHEIYIYKNINTCFSFNKIKQLIIEDIDKNTDEAILNGYKWTILHGENLGTIINVWLSKENQSNYKAKHDAARDYPNLVTWPMKYKIGEDEDKNPIYEYFLNLEELAAFYLGGINYIEQTLNKGWEEKDNIDWNPYKEIFPQPEDEDIPE